MNRKLPVLCVLLITSMGCNRSVDPVTVLEAHDVVTIRAVRIEMRVLMTLQAFMKPHGLLFLFRAAGGTDPVALTPPLSWRATFPLLDSLGSRLVVLEKRPIGRTVSRGTPSSPTNQPH